MINDFVVSSVSNSLLDFSNFGFLNQPKLDERSRFLQLRMRIGLFLSNIITLPNDPQAMGLPQTLFGIFESAISTQSDEVSQYLKIQGTTTKRGGRGSQKYFSFKNFDEKREAEILHDMNDIREELAMIKKVFSEQEEVWTAAMKTMFPKNWKDGRFVSPCVPPWHHPQTDRIEYRDEMGNTWGPLAKGGQKSKIPMNVERKNSFTAPRYAEHWRKIERPQAQFEQFKRRIAQLDEDAARVEASITVFLDMRAKHASMSEAHSTAVMSAAVFGFTLVTVIFTPLSFMTSLFALPITTFQAQQVKSSWGGKDAPGAYQTRYVGTWFATAEAVTLFVTALATIAVVDRVFYRGHTERFWDWRKWWTKDSQAHHSRPVEHSSRQRDPAQQRRYQHQRHQRAPLQQQATPQREPLQRQQSRQQQQQTAPVATADNLTSTTVAKSAGQRPSPGQRLDLATQPVTDDDDSLYKPPTPPDASRQTTTPSAADRRIPFEVDVERQ